MAAKINPGDRKIRAGTADTGVPARFPAILDPNSNSLPAL
jgi:hypothetical protein